MIGPGHVTDDLPVTAVLVLLETQHGNGLLRRQIEELVERLRCGILVGQAPEDRSPFRGPSLQNGGRFALGLPRARRCR